MLGADCLLADASGVETDRARARLSSLLSVAYRRRISTYEINHLQRALRHWRGGDAGMAELHLALSRLGRLARPQADARRLYVAEALLKRCVASSALLGTVERTLATAPDFHRLYNPNENRIPAGEGLGSGEWTAGDLLADLSAVDAESLATYALGAGLRLSPWGLLGLVFIPSNNHVKIEGKVPGYKGMSFKWNMDEPDLVLTYQGVSVVATLTDWNLFRDRHGRVIGRVLKSGVVVLDPKAAFEAATQKDEPNLCPAPTVDKPGRGARGEKDRDYEDFVKRLMNPQAPTPRGFGVSLVNPTTGKPVVYDDCQRDTGAMIEAKGTGYAKMLSQPDDYPGIGVIRDWLNQSERQIQASQGRAVIWFFAEPAAADAARQQFSREGSGRENIQIIVLPWRPSSK